MNRETVERLRVLDREFYRSSAAAFDASRRSPWPGWRRVLETTDRGREVSILDVGCGNGRFGLLAEEVLGVRLRYCGVDASVELLRAARSRGPADWRLEKSDFLDESLPAATDRAGFDLVGCFGVMHHVPGFENRRALVRRMVRRVAPGGLLAVSFWQFGAVERFRRRVVPWSELKTSANGPIDTSQLEAGDFLLRWGDLEADPAPLRFCHYCDPEEAERLVSGLDLEPVESFRADGRGDDLNLYHLLGRRG